MNTQPNRRTGMTSTTAHSDSQNRCKGKLRGRTRAAKESGADNSKTHGGKGAVGETATESGHDSWTDSVTAIERSVQFIEDTNMEET